MQKTRAGFLLFVGKSLLQLAVAFLMLLGALFAYMIHIDAAYAFFPLVASSNFGYTEMASEHHPEVQEVADRIAEKCAGLSPYPDLRFGCLLRESADYMSANFEYEDDWEMGKPSGAVTENLILSRRKKGDCIDFSVTFCSLMKHMGVSCIVRSPNGGHRMAIVRNGDTWIPVEPQNGESGYFYDKHFGGFLI